MNEKIVSVVFANSKKYPKPPFAPPKIYPEFIGSKIFMTELDPVNEVYSNVRETFLNLGLDKKNFGSKKWNPLGELVKKGQKVVIKPNLVIDSHPFGRRGIEAMITHASLIRPIIDYLFLATDNDLKVTICDVPLQSARWSELIKWSGLKKLVEYYKRKDLKVDLFDLRYEIAIQNKEGVYYKKIKKIRDPLGYQRVDLGKKSYIQEVIHDYKKLEITDYGIGTVAKHHNPQKNEYLVCKTILDADLFINVPKLKTHRKAGITASLKNLIGINGDKSWIAHHRRGVDEYEKLNLLKYLKWRTAYYLKIFTPKKFVTFVYKLHRVVLLRGLSLKEHGMKEGGVLEGNWYGNDTVWRTILDLNNIIMFSDKNGMMKNKKQRKYLSITDGIIGMEKEGPMEGFPKKSGLIVGGFNPVATDAVSAYLMGFDYKKIPQIKEGFGNKYWPLCSFSQKDILWRSNRKNVKYINLQFKPSRGWVNKIERN